MPFAAAIPLIASGISGLAGLFGGRKQTPMQTNRSTSSGTQNILTNQQQTPILNSEQQALMNLFTRGSIDRYRSGGLDVENFKTAGLRNINEAGDVRRRGVENILAARGLSYSPAAVNALYQPESQRVRESSEFLNNIPFVQRQIEDGNLKNLLAAFSVIPTGVSRTGDDTISSNQTTDQTGTQLIPGNQLGGLFSGVGAGLLAPSNAGGLSNLERILKAFGLG